MGTPDTTVFKETDNYPYFTNDIKLTAALITSGFPVVTVKHKTNPRNNKKEIHFGFEDTETQKTAAMAFLSGRLNVDARTILDNRDSLLSYVSNGSRELIDQLNRRGG
jgi:hypothetical protein